MQCHKRTLCSGLRVVKTMGFKTKIAIISLIRTIGKLHEIIIKPGNKISRNFITVDFV